MEMRTYAWFPLILDQFFTNARQTTRDAYANFVKSTDGKAQIIEYDGGERVDWLLGLLQ